MNLYILTDDTVEALRDGARYQPDTHRDLSVCVGCNCIIGTGHTAGCSERARVAASRSALVPLCSAEELREALNGRPEVVRDTARNGGAYCTACHIARRYGHAPDCPKLLAKSQWDRIAAAVEETCGE